MGKILRAADLFCGAGGSTTGAEQSGSVKVVYAVNHWITAVQTHRQNHPDVHHVCARVDQIDPWRDVPDIDVLIASPECTGHSIARGGRPTSDQKRATGWDVVRWAEAKRPKWGIVENVREWLDWGPIGKNGKPLKSRKGETFKAWVTALESLGYHVEWRLLNAADYGEATKRIRLFVIFRLGNSHKPIAWPEPTHTKAQWRPAHEIIDWSIPAPSIFGRKQPLAPKTIRRIMIGLRKFCGPAAEPFIVKMRGTSNASSIHDPAPAQTAGGTYKWVGQGKMKPVTNAQYAAVTLGFAKASGIIVLTEELVKLSTPSAEAAVRDEMVKGVTQFLDGQFVDASVSAVSNVNPASITNGVTGTPATGVDLSDARSDISARIAAFAAANYGLSGLVILMSESQAFALLLAVPALQLSD